MVISVYFISENKFLLPFNSYYSNHIFFRKETHDLIICRLLNYPKSKREKVAKYQEDVNKFLTQTPLLLNIYPENESDRKASQDRNGFIMTEQEFDFLEDQKVTRKMRLEIQ